MPLAVNDIVQVSYRLTALAQKCLFFMNYKVISTDSTGTVLGDQQAISNKFATTTTPNLLFYYLRCLSANVTILAVRAQSVRPVRFATSETLVGTNGTYGGANVSTCNLAAVISRASQFAGRSQISNSHVGPISEGAYTTGLITSAYKTLLSDLAAVMLADQFTTTPSIGLRPVILHKLGSTPFSDPVVSYKIGDSVRVMRRRTLGVGE